MSALSRSQWRQLSKERLGDARTLLTASRWSGAYHLSGLAVECALKAVIATAFKAGHWPDRGLVLNIYTHDLEKLVKWARLEADLDHQRRVNPAFRTYWQTMLLWGPDSRYQSYTEPEARDMLRAASARRDGVLAWVKQHW